MRAIKCYNCGRLVEESIATKIEVIIQATKEDKMYFDREIFESTKTLKNVYVCPNCVLKINFEDEDD